MLYCNTATVATTQRAGAGLGRHWARKALAERAGGRAEQATAGRASGEGRAGRWSAPGKQASGSRRSKGAERGRPRSWARGLATGCALGALGLFSIRIDSVLFLSRFLDIVHEPAS